MVVIHHSRQHKSSEKVFSGIVLDKKEAYCGQVQISAVIPYEYSYSEERYAIVVCRAYMNYFVAKIEEYINEDAWLSVYPIQHKPVAE